ncbi:MAG: hypothetical protein ACKVT2_08275 [Saprospiraceae bacterium]
MDICTLKMTTTHFKNLVKGALLLLVFASCEGDKEAVIQAKVAERVEAFRAKKVAECRDALLQSAERIVDSLLLSEAQNALNDSLARLRPGRPFQPAVIPPIDSLQVKPIFNRKQR